MAYLNSKNIKVYPTAYRGVIDKKVFNPESRLNTEFNITNYFVNLLTIGENDDTGSFVVSYRDSILKFVIHGYFFEINVPNEFKTGECYGIIRVKALNTSADGDNTQYKSFTLSNVEDNNAILDKEITTGTYEFRALKLDRQSSSAQNTYSLHLLHNGAIPQASKLRFKSENISNGDNNTPINQSFTTTTLSAKEVTAHTSITTSIINANTIGSQEKPLENLYSKNVKVSESLTSKRLQAKTIGTDLNPVDNLYVTNIGSETKKVEQLYATNIGSSTAKVGSLNAEDIDSDTLHASNITTDNIGTTNRKVTTINAGTINSENLTSDIINTTNIGSIEDKITTINAENVNGKNITVANTLTATNIGSNTHKVEAIHATNIYGDNVTTNSLNSNSVSVTDELNTATATIPNLTTSTITSNGESIIISKPLSIHPQNDIVWGEIGANQESGKLKWSGSSDGAEIYYKVDNQDEGKLVFKMRDDFNTQFVFEHYDNSQSKYPLKIKENLLETTAITSTGNIKIVANGKDKIILETNGNITASNIVGSLNNKFQTTEGIGSTNQPIYLSADGVLTPINSTFGGDGQLWKVSTGTFNEDNTTIGTTTTPVYVNKGKITECIIAKIKQLTPDTNATTTDDDINKKVQPLLTYNDGFITLSDSVSNPKIILGSSSRKVQIPFMTLYKGGLRTMQAQISESGSVEALYLTVEEKEIDF